MDGDLMDLDALLAPLETGGNGAGTDLRVDFSSSSPYQRLRDARAAARAEERARDAEGDSEGIEAVGWREVLSVGQKSLATHSKDFEIAAWLTEALVRIHGLQGLTAGAQLLTGLCENFWEAGFPQPDEDGMEARSSPIGGLSGGGADGTIMQPLRRLPLFRRADGVGMGVYQWDQAEQISTMDDKRRKARYAAGAPEVKTLQAEARLDQAFLIGRGRQTLAAMEAWAKLDKALEARLGVDAPSMRKVTELLERMLKIITSLGGVVTETAEEASLDTVPDGAGGTVAGGGAPGALVSRESALRELDRIAEYFRRTEPHSPLAYTLEEAVRRGRMSLSELLAEVLPDAAARNSMLLRLGIRTEDAK